MRFNQMNSLTLIKAIKAIGNKSKLLESIDLTLISNDK